MKEKKRATTIVMYGFLTIMALFMIFPLFWMVMSSFKETNELFTIPPKLFPKEFKWENYKYMFQEAPWGLYFFNTIKIAVSVVIGQVFISAMVAYAFARLRFKGREIIFAVVLATMMVPYHVTMIPTFQLLRQLGWLNTHLALIVPPFFSAFGVFMLRQFFLSIPKELEESAIIDGASYPRIFFSLVLPMSKPSIVTLAIFTFIGTWNDFLGPLIYLNDDKLKTLTLGLNSFQGTYTTQWNYMMAGAAIVTIPIVIIFLLSQKYYVSGLMTSGMKE